MSDKAAVKYRKYSFRGAQGCAGVMMSKKNPLIFKSIPYLKMNSNPEPARAIHHDVVQTRIFVDLRSNDLGTRFKSVNKHISMDCAGCELSIIYQYPHARLSISV